jgi:hypothetical protein
MHRRNNRCREMNLAPTQRLAAPPPRPLRRGWGAAGAIRADKRLAQAARPSVMFLSSAAAEVFVKSSPEETDCGKVSGFP